MLRWICLALTILIASPALAERRVALVIADEKYETLRPLSNPVNDAGAMKKALESLHFEVTLETDRDLRRTRRALEDFREDAKGADVALVYFAGHGAEISGDNRLLPVDADVSSLEAFKASTLPLDEVRATVAAVGKVGLIVLDACRNDPFGAGQGGRSAASIAPEVVQSVKPGLGRVGKAENVLFAFSAAPGQTADDGAGEHSPFASALTKFLGTEGLEIRSVMTLVQQEVYDRSGGKQLPYVENGLPKLFFASQTAESLPERERLLLAMADLTPEMRGEVEQVATASDVPLAPVYGALIGTEMAQLSPSDRMARLYEAAKAFAKVRDDLKRLGADDPEVASLRAGAEEQLSLGAFGAARDLLTRAVEVDQRSRNSLRVNFVQRTVSQAQTLALRAGSSLSGLKYRPAIEDFRTIAALYDELPKSDRTLRVMNLQVTNYAQLGAALATIGNGEAAQQAYDAAVDASRDRMDVDPGPDSRRLFSEIVGRVARTRYENGNARGALEAYQESLAAIEPLALSDPDNVLWQKDYGFSLGGVGLAQGQLGNSRAALANYAKSLAVSRRLVALEPKVAEHRENLFYLQINIGDLQTSPEESEKTYRDALASLDEALSVASDEALGEAFGLGYTRLGYTLMNMSKSEEAVEAFDKAVAIISRRYEQDPENVAIARSLVLIVTQSAQAQLMSGDTSGALDSYREVLGMVEQNRGSGQMDWVYLDGVVNAGIGDAYSAAGDKRKALEAYQIALAARIDRANRDSGNAQALLEVVLNHKTIAELGVDAKAHYREALNILLAMKKMGVLDPAYESWIKEARNGVKNSR